MATFRHPDHEKLMKEYLEQVDVTQLKILTPESYLRELESARQSGYLAGYRNGLKKKISSEPDPAFHLKVAKTSLLFAEGEIAVLKEKIELLESAVRGKT